MAGESLLAARIVTVESVRGLTVPSAALVTSANGEIAVVDDNPFLRKFYDDPARHAFQTQLFFLLERYRQQRGLHEGGVPAHGLVADYLFAKDGIFAGVTSTATKGPCTSRYSSSWTIRSHAPTSSFTSRRVLRYF